MIPALLSNPYLLGVLIGAAWLVGIGFGLALCWAAGMEDAQDELRREQGDWRGVPDEAA